MGKPHKLIVSHEGRILFTLRCPTVPSVFAAAKRYAAEGFSVRIRPVIVNVRAALRAS